MPLYNVPDYAARGMQGMQGAAQTYASMPRGSTTETRKTISVGDIISGGGAGALMGAQFAGTKAGAAALTPIANALGMGAGTAGAGGTAAAAGATAAETAAAAGTLTGATSGAASLAGASGVAGAAEAGALGAGTAAALEGGTAAAAGSAAASTASTAAASSMLGPIGMGVGAALMIGSMLL